MSADTLMYCFFAFLASYFSTESLSGSVILTIIAYHILKYREENLKQKEEEQQKE